MKIFQSDPLSKINTLMAGQWFHEVGQAEIFQYLLVIKRL